MVEAMSSATGISSVVRYRQTFMVFGAASKIWVRHQGTSGEWGTWREIIADTNIGDGIRVTNGMLSVPEYEGATATEPGTAGLVPPATVEEKDKYLKGDGTYGSGLAASVFTPPTESAPGTAGLVPAPQAVDPSQQALRVLGLNAAFNTLTAGSFDLSWERTDSTNLVLGASNCAYGTNLEDLVVAGDYYASQWTNAPADGEGVYSLREMRTYGDANSTMRVAHAFSMLFPPGNSSGVVVQQHGLPVKDKNGEIGLKSSVVISPPCRRLLAWDRCIFCLMAVGFCLMAAHG